VAAVEPLDPEYTVRTIALDGSASADAEDGETYEWTHSGGDGSFSAVNAKTTDFTAGVGEYGTYTFTLTVTDTASQTDSAETGTDIVNLTPEVTVDTEPAGGSVTVTQARDGINLEVSCADGNTDEDSLEYSWSSEADSGNSFDPSAANGLTTTVTNQNVGTREETITFTCTDSGSEEDVKTVEYTVVGKCLSFVFECVCVCMCVCVCLWYNNATRRVCVPRRGPWFSLPSASLPLPLLAQSLPLFSSSLLSV
jgi:hypothetical protein